MNVLVHYPSRGRPDLFRETLALYLLDPTVDVLVSADEDDASMNNGWMRDFLATQDRVRVRWGHSKTKVEACNDGLNEIAWDGLLILASDDMLPQRPDYAQRITQLFTEHLGADGVLHLNDGRVGRVLNTLCVCDRPYYDRFGYLYHPSFHSTWCDNEFQEVSEQLGRAAYVDEVIIKHCWIGETHPADSLHRHNESYDSLDVRTFKARKAAGFPIEWPTSRSSS